MKGSNVTVCLFVNDERLYCATISESSLSLNLCETSKNKTSTTFYYIIYLRPSSQASEYTESNQASSIIINFPCSSRKKIMVVAKTIRALLRLPS